MNWANDCDSLATEMETERGSELIARKQTLGVRGEGRTSLLSNCEEEKVELETLLLEVWLDLANAHRLLERIISKQLLKLVRWSKKEPGHLGWGTWGLDPLVEVPIPKGSFPNLFGALKRWFILNTGKKNQQLLRIFFLLKVFASPKVEKQVLVLTLSILSPPRASL